MHEKARHLVNLLRPELVKSNPVPLSSDSFTWFGLHNSVRHNNEASEATKRLRTDLISALGFFLINI